MNSVSYTELVFKVAVSVYRNDIQEEEKIPVAVEVTVIAKKMEGGVLVTFQPIKANQ
ncbi:hypothetical protein ACSTWK_004813 [Escherichia coli]